MQALLIVSAGGRAGAYPRGSVQSVVKRRPTTDLTEKSTGYANAFDCWRGRRGRCISSRFRAIRGKKRRLTTDLTEKSTGYANAFDCWRGRRGRCISSRFRAIRGKKTSYHGSHGKVHGYATA